jgi:hypothetical protein
VLAYPDYSERFEIYDDASNPKLAQSFLRRIDHSPSFEVVGYTEAIQHNLKELLAIVEILKEFKGMLRGQSIVVYKDHNNLIQDTFGLEAN